MTAAHAPHTPISTPDLRDVLSGQVIAPDGGWTAFGWIPWSGDPDAPGITGA